MEMHTTTAAQHVTQLEVHLKKKKWMPSQHGQKHEQTNNDQGSKLGLSGAADLELHPRVVAHLYGVFRLALAGGVVELLAVWARDKTSEHKLVSLHSRLDGLVGVAKKTQGGGSNELVRSKFKAINPLRGSLHYMRT